MKKCIITELLVVAFLMAFASCSDDSTFSEKRVEAQITVVTSISGLGDNGYNDEILAGVMEVANSKDVEVSLVHPSTMDEAKEVFNNWKQTATTEPKLLVLASRDYEDLARTDGTGLDAKHNVFLFESDGEGMPSGVKTFDISRFGVSYLAGCMAQESQVAYILMAMQGDNTLEEAAQGFTDGYKAHSTKGLLLTSYLSETTAGFSMSDSAYHWASGKELSFIYPLAGGSNNGIYKYTREVLFTGLLVAGMDIDCSAYSIRVPFSVIIDIKKATADYLSAWIEGEELPDKRTFMLKDGIADIKMNDTFMKYIDIWEDYYEAENYWQNMYNQYKDEAIEKEVEYEKYL